MLNSLQIVFVFHLKAIRYLFFFLRVVLLLYLRLFCCFLCLRLIVL